MKFLFVFLSSVFATGYVFRFSDIFSFTFTILIVYFFITLAVKCFEKKFWLSLMVAVPLGLFAHQNWYRFHNKISTEYVFAVFVGIVLYLAGIIAGIIVIHGVVDDIKNRRKGPTGQHSGVDIQPWMTTRDPDGGPIHR